MTVSPKQALATLVEREQKRVERAGRRALGLKQRLPSAAASLKTVYGARHVWLFGSLSEGDFRETSDVDLAVEGLDSAKYFKALADLMFGLDEDVDLVRMEDAPELLRKRILEEGIEL